MRWNLSFPTIAHSEFLCSLEPYKNTRASEQTGAVM